MHEDRYYPLRHVITFDETNLVGNVYFAHYLHWQGHCREMFLAERSPGILVSLQRGELALVTVSCGVEYYGECFAMDVVEIRMSLGPTAGNGVTMTFDYVREGVLVARGHQSIACMTRGDGGAMTPAAIPTELERALAEYR